MRQNLGNSAYIRAQDTFIHTVTIVLMTAIEVFTINNYVNIMRRSHVVPILTFVGKD